MRKIRHGMTVAAFMLVCGMVMAAPPAPGDMLKFQPKQAGVIISMPTEAEAASFKVDLVSGPGEAAGWMLKDAKGLPVRKFVATKGAKGKVDVWSYYLDGQEVYREIDTTGSGKPDQFRWYGAGGMRWGVDVNKDLKIDGWKMISAEEVSQEVLKAIATRDITRFQALLITDAELKALEIGQADADRIRQSVAQATTKFGQTAQALGNLSEKTQWLHLDVQPPQCIPADAIGGKQDIFRYKSATILYQNGDKNDWISLGELIQVGRAWRLTAAPTPGQADEITLNPKVDSAPVPPAMKPVMDKLQELDKGAPAMGSSGNAVAKYNMARASLLEQLVAGIPGKDGEQWVKQLADCLAAAAQNSGPDEKAPLLRLQTLRMQLEKDQPKGALTAYVAYREVNAEHLPKLQNAKGNDFIKVQDTMCEALKQYVAKFKDSEDAPDAAMQIANVSEFAGKENDAKTWYTNVAKDYAQHPLAPKASGALRRLAIEGQPLDLVGPTFGGGQFNIGQLKGKIVVAFYWASWNAANASDLAKLSAMMKTYAKDGVEVVTINLDEAQKDATVILQKAQLPGQNHVYGAGGLNGKLATDYGIMVLPNLFLVGKDGKVVSRNVQMSTLEDEIKKLIETK
jgi:thiol-disulfide isomerase/thioredoxin